MTEEENIEIFARRFEKPIVLVLDPEKISGLNKMDYGGKDFISHYGRKAWSDEKEWNARRVPLDAIVGVTLNENVRKVSVPESFGGGEIIKGFPSRSVPKRHLKDFDFEKEFKRDESELPYYDVGQKRVFSEKLIEDPFKYQSANQERIVHRNDCLEDEGQEYNHYLMTTGDVFRGVVGNREGGDVTKGYVESKLNSLERYLDGNPVEIYGLALKGNSDKYGPFTDKIDVLRRQWEEQPANNDIQKEAVRLNLDFLDGDFNSVRKDVDKLRGMLNEV
jgi:hypothetical protein